MTIGIYILHFPNTDKVYVGKSVNIEQRFIGHKSLLKHGKGVKKLQDAYNVYGIPTLTIYSICSIEQLNSLEEQAVIDLNSLNKGFNTLPGGHQSNCFGVYNHQSKYTEDDYYNVLVLLTEEGVSWPQISDITGVSKYIISHISAMESHGWMEERFPIEYAKLKYIHDNIGRRSAYMQGITYPKIMSPEGVLYEVTHQTNFAKEHGLLQPKLHEVLTGTRPIHKGWHLETYIPEPDYPTIVNPSGSSFVIKFGEAAKFAKEHGLTHAHLHRLLRKKANSHKGWKLA